jgi:hypothetical protein
MTVVVGFNPRGRPANEARRVATLEIGRAVKRRYATLNPHCDSPWAEAHGYLRGLATRGGEEAAPRRTSALR